MQDLNQSPDGRNNASHVITNWPGKHTEGRLVAASIVLTLAVCIPIQWFATNKNTAAEATGLVGFIYLMTMVAGLVGRGIYRSKLKTTLRLFREELPDLEAYAQAASNVNSALAVAQFYRYAWWDWCVGLSIVGFVTVGIFQLLVV